jgi:hypothetical protein
MLNKRRGILAGIVLAVMLWLSVGLTLAQEEPPVQPQDVQDQAAPRSLLDQLDTVDNGGGTVASYVLGSDWALAADDFVVTETHTPPYTYTAWIISQVVVRAAVDWVSSPGSQRASICFYGDAGTVPSSLQAMTCSSGLAATWSVDVGNPLNGYRVMTYTLPSSPLFFTNNRYWMAVQMTGVGESWFWRSRSNAQNYQSFAFTRSSGFQAGNFPLGCDGQWQAQSSTSSRCTTATAWPYGHDLSFKLIGSTFDGVLLPRVHVPLIRR